MNLIRITSDSLETITSIFLSLLSILLYTSILRILKCYAISVRTGIYF